MYKYLIVGVALLFLVSGGYYINKAGGGDLLASAFSKPPQSNLPPPTLESVTGVYTCDTSSGCNNKFVLLLRDDQTAEMIQLLNTDESSETADKVANDDTVIERTSISTETPSLEENTMADTKSLEQSTPPVNETTTEPFPNNETPLQNEDIELQPLDKNISPEIVDTRPSSTTEKGNWDIGVQNMLVITFTEQGTTTYDVPQKLVIKNVEASILSKIHYTKSLYQEMKDPVFVKQD